MPKVPLIPFQRPEPKVFAKREEARRKELLKAEEAANKSKKKKGKKMSAQTKKKAKVLTYSNTERIEDKSEVVQFGWHLLSAMDPEGELFVNDKALVIVEGDYAEEKKKAKKGDGVDPDTRRIDALGLDEDQVEQVLKYAIPDAQEEDEDGNIVKSSIVGVVFTPYQLIESIYDLAYAKGQEDEKNKVTAIMTEAASSDSDDDDDWEDEDEDDEDFDEDEDEDEDMEVIDEDEEYDEDEDEED